MNDRTRPCQGFTLIEVIVTLVLLGVLAVMAGPYLSNSIFKSVDPLVNLEKEITLQSWMEQIVAVNENEKKTLQDVIDFVSNNADGNYAVVSNGFCKLNADTNTFEVDASVASKTMVLVTIKSLTTGEQLTALFAK